MTDYLTGRFAPAPALDADEIERIAREAARPARDCDCALRACVGWESVSASLDESRLARLGIVAPVQACEPTWQEYHPHGTRYGSPDAPIALGHFPYNRCEIWQCTDCGRAFLRYTEAGGYFVDRRIRALSDALIVRTVPPESDA